MTNAIEAFGLVKRFGQTTALDGVDLAVETSSTGPSSETFTP